MNTSTVYTPTSSTTNSDSDAATPPANIPALAIDFSAAPSSSDADGTRAPLYSAYAPAGNASKYGP